MVASAKKAALRRKSPPLPADPVGARFCNFFNHPWDFLVAPVPEPGEKTQWTTKNRYPLQPRNLWEMYLDPNMILGLRFGSETRYALIDIDHGSSYHPENNLENFQAVLGAAEKIGLCRNMFVRSSESGGLHIYFFLPEPVPTFGLACAMKFALLDEGLQLGSGQLEIFPNVKAYSEEKFTNYNGHRLPLQSDSYLLDADLQPITNDISHFLNVASMHTTKQDMEKLKEAIAVSRQKATFYNRSASSKKHEWKPHLESRIAQGWTGLAQTNDLLKDITCYGIVWKGLSSPALIDYVVETAINAPGYAKYCRHQQEIRHRAAEWVHTTEKNQFYTPYCSIPQRKATYSETYDEVTNSGGANNVVPFRNAINEERSAKAMERVKEAIAHLEATNTLPTTATARALTIAQTTKALFGTTVSKTTLHKPNYLPLWHPKYRKAGCVLDEKQKVSGDSTESKKADDTVSDFLIETPEASSLGDSQKNPTPPPYMKVYDALSAPDAPQGHQGAADFNPEQGGTGGDILDNSASSPASPTTQEVKAPTEFVAKPNKDFSLVGLRLKLTAKAREKAKWQAIDLAAQGRNLSPEQRKALEVRLSMQLFWESGESVLMEEAERWAEAQEEEAQEEEAASRDDLPHSDWMTMTDDEYNARFVENEPVLSFSDEVLSAPVPEVIPPSQIGDRAEVLVYDRRKLGGAVGVVVSLNENQCRLKFANDTYGDFAIEDVELVPNDRNSE
ncbi:MAG: hypothetical protein KME25_23795 [Symplocastrum torsivum CPER-KK1]|jgi:hypothetical protein|uniref:Uncharacterized protein n=1 Tax=Symplocastrum torsivum CPER-KK1 TaxID=450513 RepID=A0A951UBY7_9CYAN|nr:hypothetical protein [Symplocastrum torsivum CPER-KK1]